MPIRRFDSSLAAGAFVVHNSPHALDLRRPLTGSAHVTMSDPVIAAPLLLLGRPNWGFFWFRVKRASLRSRFGFADVLDFRLLCWDFFGFDGHDNGRGD